MLVFPQQRTGVSPACLLGLTGLRLDRQRGGWEGERPSVQGPQSGLASGGANAGPCGRCSGPSLAHIMQWRNSANTAPAQYAARQAHQLYRDAGKSAAKSSAAEMFARACVSHSNHLCRCTRTHIPRQAEHHRRDRTHQPPQHRLLTSPRDKLDGTCFVLCL